MKNKFNFTEDTGHLKEFEKGMLYERERKRIRFNLWLGWGTIIFGAIFSVKYLFNPILSNMWFPLFLEVFGLVSISLANSEKKELKKLLK